LTKIKMNKLVSGKIVKIYGYMFSKRKNMTGTIEYNYYYR